MNRIMIAVAVAVFAMGGMLARPAEAGMKGRLAVGLAIGAIGVMAHQHRQAERREWKKKKRYQARRRAAKKVYTAKKKSTPKVKQVAKAEPAPAPLPKQKLADIAVENENSSISTAALAPIEETASIDETEAVNVVAEVPETEPAAVQETAKKLDCKKFFPTVGMTLSVPCE